MEAQTRITTLDDFLANSPDLLFTANLDATIARSSAALARELGAPEGASLLELTHPDDRDALTAVFAHLREGKAPSAFAVRLRTTGGLFRPYWLRARRATESDEVCGSLHAQTEAGAPDVVHAAKLLRILFNNLPVAVWAIDVQGAVTVHDGKGITAGGLKAGAFVGQNLFEIWADNPIILDMVRRSLKGEDFHQVLNVEGGFWENWQVPVRGENGEVEGVVGIALDISESKQIEKDLRARLEQIENQKHVIRSLATPIIQVWDDVLTMPLVGMVDSTRGAEVMEALLNEAVRTKARFAILDLTGVEVMDTATAGHLLRLVRSLRLLGTEGIITGIRPGIARTMASLGVDMENILTLRSLREGLKLCMERSEGGEGPALSPSGPA